MPAWIFSAPTMIRVVVVARWQAPQGQIAGKRTTCIYADTKAHSLAVAISKFTGTSAL